MPAKLAVGDYGKTVSFLFLNYFADSAVLLVRQFVPRHLPAVVAGEDVL